MTTANDALRVAIARLTAAGIDSPARDARLLLAHAMALPADRLTLHLQDSLATATADSFNHLIDARLTQQPVAQIIGRRLFWGRQFIVTPDVLDPRPETETLIAEALRSPAQTILDLGTGSGIILLTLLAEWPAAVGTGVDISPAALGVAQANAHALSLAARATFAQSDWFAATQDRYDLIVSNPPYIAADEMHLLSPDVRDHEPHIALTPGGDGLDAYRAIAAGAAAHLAPAGRILVEIGPTQGPAVLALFVAAGLQHSTIAQDMDGRDRIVTAFRA